MLDPLFKPGSVAVVGASDNPLSIGHRVVKNLLDHHFRGAVFPVNPNADSVLGLKAYPSVLDVPGKIDLVNIAISRARVPAVLEECGRKGVKFAIIHTAGFRETGGEGLALEREILDIGRRHGVRIYGPNSQGVQNSDAAVSVYANFTFTPMIQGNVSVAAQSGGVGETLKVYLSRAGLGIRMYASYGNEADVGLDEIIGYFGDDSETRVILLHVETLKDPGGFLAAARRITPKKPVLALKTGRTSDGSRAVASHTGSLVGDDELAGLVFRKAGVLRFAAQEEMIHAALALSLQPLPRGNRVAIVTNTGGPGVIAVDECASSGLVLAELGTETKDGLRRIVSPEAIVTNPVDLVATAGPAHFGDTIDALMADPGVDSVLLIFVTAPFVDCPAIARRIADRAGACAKPLIAQVITDESGTEVLGIMAKARIPVFGFAESAARALAALARQGGVVRNAAEEPAAPVRGKGTAAERIRRAGSPGRFLPREDLFSLLGDYDIPTAATLRVADRTELPRAAERLGYPLVLKADGDAGIHKMAAGRVALDLRTPDELVAAFDRMTAALPENGRMFALQKYLAGGREIIMGVKGNAGLAPTVMFGLGGIFVEALKDVQLRLAPLSRPEALDMIRSIRGLSALEEMPGAGPADIPWLAEILVRLSQLAVDVSDIDELDLNPILVFQEGRGGVVVDARLKVK
jgi:acyl-CoA synthetase (NDP forming)